VTGSEAVLLVCMATAKRDHELMEKRRRRAASLFDKGYSPAEVARQLGVSRQSTSRWKADWQSAGTQGLASKGQAGRKSRLNPRQREQVAAALVKGPLAHGYRTDLWTLPRVALLIKDLTGVRYHVGHIWHLLRALGFSCQRPTRRALERDELKIAHWKRYRWPHIKKKPVVKVAPSFSSTKAG
jgi:transposase